MFVTTGGFPYCCAVASSWCVCVCWDTADCPAPPGPALPSTCHAGRLPWAHIRRHVPHHLQDSLPAELRALGGRDVHGALPLLPALQGAAGGGRPRLLGAPPARRLPLGVLLLEWWCAASAVSAAAAGVGDAGVVMRCRRRCRWAAAGTRTARRCGHRSSGRLHASSAAALAPSGVLSPQALPGPSVQVASPQNPPAPHPNSLLGLTLSPSWASVQVAPNIPPVGQPYADRQCCGSPLEALHWMFKMQTAPSVGGWAAQPMLLLRRCGTGLALPPVSACCLGRGCGPGHAVSVGGVSAHAQPAGCVLCLTGATSTLSSKVCVLSTHTATHAPHPT